jgi:hypothetical protein
MLIHAFAMAAMSLAWLQATPQFDDVFAGDCAVTVVLPGARVGDVVQVMLDLGRLRDQNVTDSAQMNVEVPTGSPPELRLRLDHPNRDRGQLLRVTDRPGAAGRKAAGNVRGSGRVAEGDSLRATAYFDGPRSVRPDSLAGPAQHHHRSPTGRFRR